MKDRSERTRGIGATPLNTRYKMKSFIKYNYDKRAGPALAGAVPNARSKRGAP